MLTTAISMLFALCAVLAASVIAGSLRRAAPLVRELRTALRVAPEPMTMRTRVTTIAVTRASATVYRPDFAAVSRAGAARPALRAA